MLDRGLEGTVGGSGRAVPWRKDLLETPTSLGPLGTGELRRSWQQRRGGAGWLGVPGLLQAEGASVVEAELAWKLPQEPRESGGQDHGREGLVAQEQSVAPGTGASGWGGKVTAGLGTGRGSPGLWLATVAGVLSWHGVQVREQAWGRWEVSLKYNCVYQKSPERCLGDQAGVARPMLCILGQAPSPFWAPEFPC